MKKLAIVTSHPIQYNAPLFKLINDRAYVKIKVFYTWGERVSQEKYDPGFGKVVDWDVPLLEGYEFSFVRNIAEDAGSHHFKGIDNPGITGEIEKWNPDAVLVFGWNFKSHLKILRYFKGKKPVLFRGDSNLLDEAPGFSIKKIFKQIFLTWVYKYIDMALYVGSANKSYYLKYGLKEKQLRFAPHAIDNNRFHSDSNNRLREELGIPANSIVFLFAGKMEEKKNPLLLIQAFLQINNPQTYLLMVGNGTLDPMLKKKADSFQPSIGSRIHFTDFMNQRAMPGIYKTADVFVLPSKGPRETWGLAVNEAMASGKAVLVSDKCGCGVDLVQENINGYVFKSNNLKDLTDKMKKIMVNKDRLPLMGKASAKIISDWSFSNICEAIEDVMTNLTVNIPNN